jgi:hypothetical protein
MSVCHDSSIKKLRIVITDTNGVRLSVVPGRWPFCSHETAFQ